MTHGPAVRPPARAADVTTYERASRFILCDHCGAPVEVASAGGRIACAHCRAPLELRMRVEAAIAGERPGNEAERARRLAASDPRFVAPPPVADLFAGERVAPAREAEAFARWQALRAGVRAAPDAAGTFALVVLTIGLAERLFARGQLLRQRALLESALELSSSPSHRQLLLAELGRSACRAGDSAAAEAWLRGCDARSDDLAADTAYRFSRAYLDTARGAFADVVRVLGPSHTPTSDLYGAECAVLRANAWERLGQRAVAVDLLAQLKHDLGPLARRRAQRFAADHASWQLCRSSEPEAERLAVALTPAPPYDPDLGVKVVLVMAVYSAFWAAGGVALAVARSSSRRAGMGGFLLSVASGVVLAAILGPVALLAMRRARARKRLLSEGHGRAARVLGARTSGEAFGGEGLVEVRLDLWVTPDDGPAYRTTASVTTSREAARRFTPGENVVVRADPSNPASVAVDMA